VKLGLKGTAALDCGGCCRGCWSEVGKEGAVLLAAVGEVEDD